MLKNWNLLQAEKKFSNIFAILFLVGIFLQAWLIV